MCEGSLELRNCWGMIRIPKKARHKTQILGQGPMCIPGMDVYGGRFTPRCSVLRNGSIEPQCSVRFVAADVRSARIRSDP